jgi:pimeloyl-ACP methyl ester carboxylesterase
MTDNKPPVLACREAGPQDKPALVLLHGFGGSGHYFDPIVEELAAKARIVLPDLPGHGRSFDVAGSRHPRAAAEAVLATMDALGCERFHLAGFSLGGAVASLIALQAPKRVLSLTLLAPGGYGAEIAAETLREFAVARTPEAVRSGLAKMTAPGSAAPEEGVAQIVSERTNDALVGELEAIAAMITRDGKQGAIPRDMLAGIACPVRIVWGTADPVLPVTQSNGLPADFDLRLVEGAGHLLVEEARDAVVDALSASLG